MTPDEINRAIAEHLGWMAHPTYKSVWRTPEQARRNKSLIGTVNGPWSTASLRPPNYAEDLNAIHKALQSLTEVELFRYADEVCDLTCDSNHDTDIQTMLMLSAKELAECYVRAIGKWRGA